MRVLIDRFSSAVRGRRLRSLGLAVIAVSALLLGAMSFSMALTAVIDPRPGDAGAATFCAVCGGGVPWLFALGTFLAKLRYDRGTRELQQLFTEASDEGRIDRAALIEKGWTRERADEVLLDALAHGLLGDESTGASLRPGAALASRPPAALPPPAPLPALGWPAPQALADAVLPGPENATPNPRPAYESPPGAVPTQESARALIITPPVDPKALAETRAGRHDERGAEPRARSGQTSALTGRVLKGTYLVEEALGQGGMGAVWAARHLRTGKRVAVKTLLPSERISRDSIARFEREARAASSIGHAGIVPVHDFDRTEDGLHYLVMELLRGETLETRLGRAGRLEWSETRKIALEVADALAAAHRSGILHRDLKPANVFLAQIDGLGERAVLVDFGLAKPIEESARQRVTSTGAVVGTALYMSPEQARADRSLDPRSDLYGLAAVVYEMVAGVPPFLGPSAIAVMSMVLAEQVVAPSLLARGIPPELDRALVSALSKSPDDRPPDVATFARLLAAIA